MTTVQHPMPEVKLFHFEFPITDFKETPAMFVGNLDVQARATIKGDALEKVEIVKIIAFDGNVIGVRITGIIKAIAPDTYDQIKLAANGKAEEIVRQRFAIPQ